MEILKIFDNPSRESWEALSERKSSREKNVTPVVRKILSRVKKYGDRAIEELSEEIDGMKIGALEVSEAEFREAEERVSDDVKRAIAVASANIKAFHTAQLPSPVKLETTPGVVCYQKAVPIDTVGLYIPGGTAPLFSTVLMLAIPAKVTGCRKLVMCTPISRGSGKVSAEVLYAARICGIDRVFKVGGAQAIAAMAYGTRTVPRVDKIFGPGNRFVTTAKQLLGGNTVAIDMPAGPSEVMVLADSACRKEFVAADLLSQAEHGADSQVMLVCDSARLASEIRSETLRQASLLPRNEFVMSALGKSRAVVLDRKDFVDFADIYAPEHLIISTENPWEIAGKIKAAGSIFIGDWSPESAGDYASGTNHTLPTSGWARSYSGVNTDSFMRKITYQELTREGLEALSGTITKMAEAEGLEAHANAVKIRLGK